MKGRAVVTPLALVALAGAAIAYALLVDRGTISDADRAARRHDVFPSFRVDEVTRIELEQGGDTLVLERPVDAGTPGAWRLVAPRSERADAAAVDALLRELELATRLRDVTQEGAAGLDAPRVRGRLSLSWLEYRFALGADAHRPEGASYMRLDGEGTFVVGRSLTVQLLRGADAYRDRVVVPLGMADVARLDVTGPGGQGFVLERAGMTFRLAREGTRASRAAVEHIFAALADARVETFLDDAAADRAQGDGAIRVVLSPRDASRSGLELRVGGACPGEPHGVVVVRLGAERVAACVAATLAEALSSPPASLRDSSPFYAHADEIEEVRLERVGEPRAVEIARKGSGWHERRPDDRDLAADEVDSANALVAALADARAAEVRRPAAGEVLSAQVRATVVRTGASVTERVELAAPGGGLSVWARRLDDGAWLRLPRAIARRFEPHPVALRARPVWRPPLEEGALVAIDDSCGPDVQEIEQRAGAWVFRSPRRFAVDPASAGDLAGAVVRAKADAWIAESDDGTFGFAGGRACSVTLSTSSGDAAGRRATLSFGDDAPGGVYARTSEDPAVFLLPSVLRGLAARPVLDRRPFHVDVEALVRLVVVRAGVREQVPLADGDGGRLLGAVGALYAQSALHVGASPPEEGFARPALEILASERAEGGPPRDVRIVVGASAQVEGAAGYFARVDGVDATFFVPAHAVDSIVAAP